MLSSLNLGDGRNIGTSAGQIALDCSVRKTRQDHYVISTTDFFFPLVDSPYLQGRIGCANVLSDLYATGVSECDFVLMLLASCRDMPDEEREICTREMVRGFRDCCDEAGTAITGGQTVLNPWPIIGGVATSIVSSASDFVQSDRAQPGNVVVLTKPLGTQIAVNVHQWKRSGPAHLWKKCIDEQLFGNNDNGNSGDEQPSAEERMMHAAVCSMARLNRTAASLLLEYGATACTDVTGFGILGHAQNLSDNQLAKVGIVLRTLPCIAGTMAVNDRVFDFGLRKGTSAETSGGLLACFPTKESATAYCDRLLQQPHEQQEAWIVGEVVADDERKSRIVEDVTVLEV